MQVNIYEAKTRPSELVEQADAGATTASPRVARWPSIVAMALCS